MREGWLRLSLCAFLTSDFALKPKPHTNAVISTEGGAFAAAAEKSAVDNVT
jgi:hypothetical protein